jgi:branched-chain amino acid transport system ATP-binding protein
MLRLNKVSAGYGSFQALFDISLEVKAGETVAVIGPNGAGKTTLLRVVSKLIEPLAGEMTMEGRRLNDVRAHQVIGHGIAHVPENRRLFPRLSVEENLKMGAFLPAARARFAERLEAVYTLFPSMRQRRGQAAGTLSGGEQQMLAVARALMSRPKLLLMDEPSLGLAPLVVEEIFAIIADLHRDGATIFLVEQNAHMALRVAQRFYLMEQGRVTFSGDPGSLAEDEVIRRAYLGSSR